MSPAAPATADEAGPSGSGSGSQAVAASDKVPEAMEEEEEEKPKGLSECAGWAGGGGSPLKRGDLNPKP